MFCPNKFMLLLAVGVALSALAGCGSSSSATPPEAPAKPLSQAQENLLKQIEAVPQDKRSEFAMRHMGEIAQYAADNKTFGERMNAVAGVSQKGVLK